MTADSSAKRYQPRISLDPRMGELWDWLMSLPEPCRKSQLLFLLQLGFTVHKALDRAVPAGLTNALGTEAVALPPASSSLVATGHAATGAHPVESALPDPLTLMAHWNLEDAVHS
jgi:hypothetical protein